jgi:hypothetical protein
MKNSPKLGVKCLKKGKTRIVEHEAPKTSPKTTRVAKNNCNLNLVPDEIPLLLRILFQSSQKPRAPKPIMHNKKIQTCGRVKSHHNKALISTIAKINTPPMVGILSFFLWVSGVNSRALDRKKRREIAIKYPPNSRKLAKEVSKEATARTLT